MYVLLSICSLNFFIIFLLCFVYSYLYCYTAIYPNNTTISITLIDHLCCMNKAAGGWTRDACTHACCIDSLISV